MAIGFWIICLVLVILYIYLYKNHRWKKRVHNSKTKQVAVILGSGGHTQEMILLLQRFDFKLVESILYLT